MKSAGWHGRHTLPSTSFPRLGAYVVPQPCNLDGISMNIQEENSAHYFRVQSECEQTLVSSGQILYQAASWKLILQSSMLQRFTAESSLDLGALRKLNNKQRQVLMFLILLLKFLTHFPFLYLSSHCFLSQYSLFSLSTIPSFSSG